MGVKSTHTITRTLARQILSSKVFTMSDKELEDALESLEESTYRNYSVVNDHWHFEGDELRIEDISDF